MAAAAFTTAGAMAGFLTEAVAAAGLLSILMTGGAFLTDLISVATGLPLTMAGVAFTAASCFVLSAFAGAAETLAAGVLRDACLDTGLTRTSTFFF